MNTIQLNKSELLSINGGGIGGSVNDAIGLFTATRGFLCGLAEGWNAFWSQDLKIR
jgi:hypothetical protein